MDGWGVAGAIIGWDQPGLLEHCEHERTDPAWLAKQWADPTSRLLSVDANGGIGPVGEGGNLIGLPTEGDFDEQRHFLLGVLDGVAVFAQAGESEPSVGLRALLPVGGRAERELAVTAAGLVNWHRTSPHCATCGTLTIVRTGGLVRYCATCQRERFPRTDPAIIVAVIDADDRLLLGHQASWPAERVSILAGFVSAGESLEQAVYREVGEESGVRLSAVRYLGSQPWPFPRSLMIGFAARADVSQISVDKVELDRAAWFTREELALAEASGQLVLPGPASIAHLLIQQWREGTLPPPEG